MAPKNLALWLLLVGAVLPQGRAQHWSYGLSPGGKRDLDILSDTLDNLVEAFPHVDTPCSVLGCAEESLFPKIYRTKGFLGSVPGRDNGHRTDELKTETEKMMII
ncbi:progonadoliberin-1-like [Cottoperca gobio]|uniref:Progonadoliberin-1-like n=1 Tax=Cottoperca gobio TaxID=56716 RepID=A0A6J2QAI0_COTGO|nr:progonadoliberin-1-like [Cottoperca gobio]